MKCFLFLFAISGAFASTSIECFNSERKYEVQVRLYDSTADINFLQNGSVYKSYTGAPYTAKMRNVLFSSKKKIAYEFEFLNEKATYLRIERKTIKGNALSAGDGVFLPFNSVFWPDAELICSFE